MVWDALKTCYDPEIPVNIVDLGLVYLCELEDAEEGGKNVKIKMTLTAPGCGMGPVLASDVKIEAREPARREERRRRSRVRSGVGPQHDVRGGAAAARHDVVTGTAGCVAGRALEHATVVRGQLPPAGS